MSNPEQTRFETGSVAVDGIPVFFRRLPGDGPPAVFIHGVPTNSGDFVPFMELMKGPAVAFDLPGFGRSGRPDPEEFDSSVHAYGAMVPRILDALEVEEHSLVLHDWGGVALIGAQLRPQLVRRLCVINCVPFLPGYRWHRTARMWRTPVLGELTTRSFTRRGAELALREARGDWSRMPDRFVDMLWEQLDRGTFDSILRLYRSAPEDELERLGARLGAISCPSLVVWGLKDRYLPARFGGDYAAALPDSELFELPRAGHWPWWEDQRALERVIRFLEP